ncbi:MAG TPA: hypothetical protein VIF09_24635, partial [Polyangiaceae bacterium]
MRRLSALSLAFLLAAFVGLVAVGCGSRSDLAYGDGGIYSGDGSTLPPGCGDGVCSATESCATCSVDCGVCKTCGDHVCQATESCSSCPEDCGACATCGDGYCNGNETCENCAADCGVCKTCGDGVCQKPGEDCYSCPADCGQCAGCGDGTCTPPETCASCEADCGACAVCGNGKCESPYETCLNCPQDCGQCTPKTCLQVIECLIPCLGGLGGGGGPPPNIASCAITCSGQACAAALSLIDDVVTCISRNINQCTP